MLRNSVSLLILLLLPFSLFSQEKGLNYSKFIGSWSNENKNSKGIVKFKIFEDKQGGTLINLKGKCFPSSCDIGPYRLTFYGSSVSAEEAVTAIANYKNDWSNSYYILRLNSQKKVELSSFTKYDDARSNSFFSETFTKF